MCSWLLRILEGATMSSESTTTFNIEMPRMRQDELLIVAQMLQNQAAAFLVLRRNYAPEEAADAVEVQVAESN